MVDDNDRPRRELFFEAEDSEEALQIDDPPAADFENTVRSY